jgi:SRSO17 transposase
VDPDRWRAVLDEATARIAGRFVRREPRAAAAAFVTGLLSTVERKTCWSLAERAGYRHPARFQRLLRTAVWDADAAAGDVRGFVADRLGHADGVLIPDETGFVKKGTSSVGVQRQYSGTAGRVENSQVGVFLAYASPLGRALVDRRIYLPEQSWCEDTDRRNAAGIPAEVEFATKPRLALDMIDAAIDVGLPASWVTADEVYGSDPDLRTGLEARGIGYVLAIGCNRRVAVNHGRTRMRVDDIATGLGRRWWHRMSAGIGAKGPRDYDWAAVQIGTGPGTDPNRWLLVRRHPSTGELAYYLCWTTHPVPLAALVRVAGIRWSIEELFQTAKTHVGLDHYQVRGWTGWHRHTTLALLALAVLAVCTAVTEPTPPDPTRHARHTGPIALTMAEIRRLIGVLISNTINDTSHHMHWSDWRRHHQGQARHAHYQRRLALLHG